MSGLLRWARRHPIAVDALFAGALFVITAGAWFGHNGEGQFGSLVFVGVPLAFRRRYPRAVFAVVAGAAFVQYLTFTPLQFVDAAIVVALYTVVARCRRIDAIAAAVVVELGIWLAAFRFSGNPVGAIVVLNVIATAAVLIAETMRIRREYLVELEERAVRLERERDQQAQLAVAAERARIARELHDIVAHNVSVMVAQADGARFTIRTDPQRASDAMQVVARIGRDALAEMRRLLDVLRPEDARTETAPQPGLEQVDDLVARLRDAGLHVELYTEGTPRSVPAGPGLAAYRTIQEALTNTFRHAGPTAVAAVHVRYDDDRIVIRVDDDGPPEPKVSNSSTGAGHGLLGMRERAEMYGGLLKAGPLDNGGYRVDAQFPTRAAS